MNSLDVILLVLLLPGVIRGISKGFLEQAISLLGIIVSVWAAFHFQEDICGMIQPHLPELPETILHITAFAIILLLVSLLALLLAKVLTKVVKMATLGWVNRLLGALAALLLGISVLSVGIIVYDSLNSQLGFSSGKLTDASFMYKLLKDFGYTLFPYLKQLIANGQDLIA
ncbi:MAG: CvpA family protein [Bacteroidales bacterium]|nr:CvpA family protein [Bacteroidales bacterium]